ncbi:MAG: alanine racemase [Gemmatimonadota bacterium]|nr:alanine racemase [Gemmatimonadota bacterium]
MDLASVETPVGVVDLDRARENIERAIAYCRTHGIAWRPHVKTHKSLEMARLQLKLGATGLTVATAHEAYVMSQATGDLLLAHPPASAAKVDRLCALPRSVDLTVGLDSIEVLRLLARGAAAAERTFGIVVEFDAGLGRTGVTDPAEAVRVAEEAVSLPGVRFDGLMFYPGHIRIPRSRQAGRLERLSERIEAFVAALCHAGFPPRVVSGGSTPTLWDSHLLPGVTEVRSGTCIYNDRDIVGMGAAAPEHVAYTVLATVISVSVPGAAVVDAGSKALSKETLGSGAPGYGVLFDRPEVSVRAINEEHGVLDLSGTAWRPSVGDQLRLVPNHVCVSVNLQDHLWGIQGEGSAARPVRLEGRGRLRVPDWDGVRDGGLAADASEAAEATRLAASRIS